MPVDPRKNRKRKRVKTTTTRKDSEDESSSAAAPPVTKAPRRKREVMEMDESDTDIMNEDGPSREGLLRGELQTLRVTQLREQCVQRGLLKGGRKADLVERLVQAYMDEHKLEEEKHARLREEEEERETQLHRRNQERQRLREQEERRRMEQLQKSRPDPRVASSESTKTNGSDRERLRKAAGASLSSPSSSSEEEEEEEEGGDAEGKADENGASASSAASSVTSALRKILGPTPEERRANELPIPTSEIEDADNWDSNFWNELVRCAHTREITTAAPIYERVCRKYPAYAPYWRAFSEHCLREKDWTRLASIFQRSLPVCRDVDLYIVYLNYMTSRPREKGASSAAVGAAQVVADSFKFALNHVGQQRKSHVLWEHFIAFLNHHAKEAQGNDFEHSNRVDELRKWYRCAVKSATRKIEDIWDRFRAFESLHMGDVMEFHESYITARGVLEQRERRYAGIVANAPPEPPEMDSSAPKYQAQRQQLRLWRILIEYEKGNPLHRSPLEHREDMRMLYYRCLSPLRYFPDIWHDFANYERSVSVNEEDGVASAAEIYRQAHEAIPNSVVLGLAYAEIEEQRSVGGDPLAVFEVLWKTAPCALMFVEHQRTALRVQGVKAARAIFKRARSRDECTWRVFAAAAMLEYNCNRRYGVACKIFELGMKRYSESVPYVRAYANLLGSNNDEENLRALYERTLSGLMKVDRDTAMIVWYDYLRFEAQQVCSGGRASEFSAILTRWREAYPNCEALQALRSTTLRCSFDGPFELPGKSDAFVFANSAPLPFDKAA
eukprot:g1254.t1